MPTTNNELAQILKFLDAQRPTAPSDATRVEQEELIPQLRIPGQDVVELAEPRREASISTGYSDREMQTGYTDEAISDIAMGMITPGGGAKNVLAKWKGKKLMEAFKQRSKESGEQLFPPYPPKHRPHYVPEIINNKKVYTVDRKLGDKRYDYVPKVDLNPNAAKQSFAGQQQSFVDGQYLIEESVKVGAMKGNKVMRMKHNYAVKLNDKFSDFEEVGAISFTSRMQKLSGTQRTVPVIENIQFAAGKKFGPNTMQKSLDNLSGSELRRATMGATKMIQSFASRFPDGTIIRFGLDNNKNSMTLDSFNFMISAVAKYAKRILMSPEWKHQVIRKYDTTGSTSALSKMSQKEAAEALVAKMKAKLGDKAHGVLEVSPSKVKEGRPFEIQEGALDISSFEIEMKGRLAAMIGIPLSQVDDMLEMIEEDAAR